MEHVSFNYFKDAGKHGLGTVLSLALISALLEVCLKLIEQVIDDVCRENSYTVLICKGLGIGHDLDVKSKNSSKLFLHVLTLE